jgi:hypothetical protein
MAQGRRPARKSNQTFWEYLSSATMTESKHSGALALKPPAEDN